MSSLYFGINSYFFQIFKLKEPDFLKINNIKYLIPEIHDLNSSDVFICRVNI